MNTACRRIIASCLLLLGTGAGTAGSQAPSASGREEALPLDAPATQLDPVPSAVLAPADSDAVSPEARVKAHEAIEPPVSRRTFARQHVKREPPATIAERPSSGRPDRRAQWVPGYWDWDQSQNDYVWVGGFWQVPPAGSMWVAGRWMRDNDGWYRVPGVWSRRRDAGAKLTAAATAAPAGALPQWRRTGPPADHPNDAPGVAPGPDYFYIAGHYVPDGDQVTWKPGFWAKAQAGWDWSPARWVRRPDGWDFRPGSWVRETSAFAQNSEPSPRSTARPGLGDAPSSAVEPQARPSSPEANLEEPPPIAGGDIEVGAIPGAAVPSPGQLLVPETVVPPGAVVIREPQPVVIGRVTGLPYFVVRPPGFPYGPAGVVVPAVVPRFVRRILDRVLP
ncbi:MAG: hypothetical protein ACLQIB_55850 [Isosphaeraceae bacterium]